MSLSYYLLLEAWMVGARLKATCYTAGGWRAEAVWMSGARLEATGIEVLLAKEVTIGWSLWGCGMAGSPLGSQTSCPLTADPFWQGSWRMHVLKREVADLSCFGALGKESS
ncbi:hypothetical protein SASPL_145204 [Salvia splendens]|uniref:Secreted protein n=1 Tax=Salvia splendens TaxID=180675 RepID=A0A8X8WH39_SALSN|nr:hypothetical protein SASPL_145204 [Salvia splendens]